MPAETNEDWVTKLRTVMLRSQYFPKKLSECNNITVSPNGFQPALDIGEEPLAHPSHVPRCAIGSPPGAPQRYALGRRPLTESSNRLVPSHRELPERNRENHRTVWIC